MRNFAGRPINGPNGTLAASILKYDWIEGWDKRPGNGHTEWYNGAGGNPGVRNVTVDHDVILQYKYVTPFGPAPMWLTNSWPGPVDAYTFTNNVQINAFLGGGTKTAQVWGCYGTALVSATPPTAPTCSGAAAFPNINFYATQITGAIGQGQEINLGVPDFWLYKPLGVIPSGAVGAWQIEPNVGTPIGPGNITNYTTTAEIANVAVMSSHGETPLGTSVVANNYIDPSSQSGATNSQLLYVKQGVQIGFTGSISGISLLTSTAQSFPIGSFISGVGVTGCATNTLGCPTIVSGSGTSWTLNTSGGTIPSQVMDAVQLAWCTTPTNFHGNIDMSGLTSDTYMNEWSVLGLEVGC